MPVHRPNRVNPIVRVEPLGADIEMAPGENLMDAAERVGYRWPTICKGNAQCNRCAVVVLDGAGLEPPSATELAGLRAVRWREVEPDPRDRLACQLRAHADAIVEKRGVSRRLSAGPSATNPH